MSPIMHRRDFLRHAAVTLVIPCGAREAIRAAAADVSLPLRLEPASLVGGLKREAGAAPIDGATWYAAEAAGDGLAYRFPAGALAGATHLTADMLVDGEHLAVFQLVLQEGDDGPSFTLTYAALNQCSARMRMRAEAVNQNRWRYDREAAWLKPMCGGQRVDLARVDRMIIKVLRKSGRAVRWCQTPVTATALEPPRLTTPLLPKGPLIDDLGQSRLHDWPTKTRTPDEMVNRLKAQLAHAPDQRWPESFSTWGGLRTGARPLFDPTGFFRTHHDGRRWWLVDPEGHPFWSAGMDCVRVDTPAAYRGLEAALSWTPDRGGPFGAVYAGRPDSVETINYLAANFIRTFGPDAWYDRWTAIALSELRRLGFNTVGNWSDWQIAQAARFPYVRPLTPRFPTTPRVYRDMPDVFDPAFARDAAVLARELAPTRDDPAFIGYFLMNEPTWGFARETPAAGMLFTSRTTASRRALADFLRKRHGDSRALAAAWGMPVTLDAVAEGEWRLPLTKAAEQDLASFSAVMVERFFKTLTDACRAVDPHHLNLGIRYHTVPPPWALDGMRTFDVFSMNCYESRVRAAEMQKIAELLHQPVLVGEWHFGALDAGLPASGIGHVRDQSARGRAYRVYLEDAAAKPWCVGAHWFTLYDESAIGRFDGENWNIGFLDVCNRPYEPLADAARASHERLYAIARGETAPYDEAPEYLPKLFL